MALSPSPLPSTTANYTIMTTAATTSVATNQGDYDFPPFLAMTNAMKSIIFPRCHRVFDQFKYKSYWDFSLLFFCGCCCCFCCTCCSTGAKKVRKTSKVRLRIIETTTTTTATMQKHLKIVVLAIIIIIVLRTTTVAILTHQQQ